MTTGFLRGCNKANYVSGLMLLASLYSMDVQALTVHQTIDDWRDRDGIVTTFTGFKPKYEDDPAPGPVTVTNWFGKNEKVTSDGAFVGWKYKNQITYLDRTYWWPDTCGSRINLREWGENDGFYDYSGLWWIFDGYEDPNNPGVLIRPCDRPSDEVPVLNAVYRLSPNSDFWFEQFLHFNIGPQRDEVEVGTVLSSDIPTFTVDFVAYFPVPEVTQMPYSGTLAVWSETYYDNVEPGKEFYKKIPFTGTLSAQDPERQQSLCTVSRSLGEKLPAGRYRAYMEVRSPQARNEPIWLDVTFKVTDPNFAVEVEPKMADWQAGSLTLHLRVANSPSLSDYDSDQAIAASGKRFNIWRANGAGYQDFANAKLVGVNQTEANWTDEEYAKNLGVWPAKYWVQVFSGEEQNVTAKPSSEPSASCVAGRRFAIRCGFDRYMSLPNGDDVNAHSHTMAEVERMREVLTKNGLLEKEYDCTNEKGTVEGITNAWKKAANDTKPGDTLFFYISTHGGALANNEKYSWLQTWETKAQKRGYMSADMRKDLEKFPAENGVKVINIIDACFSGAMYEDNKDVNPANIAWICSSTSNQLSDCVISVSQFAQTFVEWGWRDGCADLAKLENVSGYSNPYAGDGMLNLWEIANYSRALVTGGAWHTGEDRPDDNVLVNLKHKQIVIMAGESLLKNTIVATGIDSPRTTHVPGKIGLWAVGLRTAFMYDPWIDVICEYSSKYSNCYVRVNSAECPWLFFDMEYAADRHVAHSYVRATMASETLSRCGYMEMRLYENGANSLKDKDGDECWRSVYFKGGPLPGHKKNETLGVEYVPLERGETYALRIRAVNEYGFGPWSKPVSFETGKKDEEEVSISSSSDTSVSGVTIAAVSLEGEDLGVEVAVSRTDGSRTVYEGTLTMNAARTMLSGSVSCGDGSLAVVVTKDGAVTASSDGLTITGALEMPSEGLAGGVEFVESEIEVEEGTNLVVRVVGGNEEKASSVKVYLTYQTAAASDLNLGKTTYPLTLKWAAGEVGEKTITIPVKADALVEGEEMFTLQLAAPSGMTLGEVRTCTVYINDAQWPNGMSEEEAVARGLAAVPTGAAATTNASGAVMGYVTKKDKKGNVTAKAMPGHVFTGWYLPNGKLYSTKATITDKERKAKKLTTKFAVAYYLRALADPKNGGTATGSGKYAEDKVVTLKATPAKYWTFEGWRCVEDAATFQTASIKVTVTNDATYVAMFKPYPKVTVAVNDAKGGTVKGAGSYLEGKTATLKATPKKGYAFIG